MLLKEKALLFKDYVQPYHFLSHEKGRPETSSESIYGSSFSGCPTAKSDNSPIKRKRSYLPKMSKQRTLLSLSKEEESSTDNMKASTVEGDSYSKRDSTESSSKRDTDSSGKRKQRQKVIDSSNNVKSATSSGSAEKDSNSIERVKQGRDFHNETKKTSTQPTPVHNEHTNKKPGREEVFDSSVETRDDTTLRTSNDTDIYNTKGKGVRKDSSSIEDRETLTPPSSPEAHIRSIRKFKETRDMESTKSQSGGSSVKPVKRDFTSKEMLKQRTIATKQSNRNNIMSLPISHATSMEWDPFLSHNKHKEKSYAKQTYASKRQISPISEEGTDMSLTISTSTDAHLDTDDSSTTFDTTYHDSASALAKSATEYSDNSRSPGERSGKTTTVTESASTVRTTDTNTPEKSKTSKEKAPTRSRPSKRDYTSLDARYTNNK